MLCKRCVNTADVTDWKVSISKEVLDEWWAPVLLCHSDVCVSNGLEDRLHAHLYILVFADAVKKKTPSKVPVLWQLIKWEFADRHRTKLVPVV